MQISYVTLQPEEINLAFNAPYVILLLINIFLLISFMLSISYIQIMIVTAGFRPRRQDPITFNAFHFSAANFLTTIYAAVMLGTN